MVGLGLCVAETDESCNTVVRDRESGPWTAVEVVLICGTEPLDDARKPTIACFITAISWKEAASIVQRKNPHPSHKFDKIDSFLWSARGRDQSNRSIWLVPQAV